MVTLYVLNSSGLWRFDKRFDDNCKRVFEAGEPDINKGS